MRLVEVTRTMATRNRKRMSTQRHKVEAAEVLDEEEERLFRLDPSLMTERQQLAFLLRTTAHEASNESSSGNESPGAETETSLRLKKKPRRRIRLNNTNEVAPTVHRGSGRPNKSKKNVLTSDTKLNLRIGKETNDKKVVNKCSPCASDDIAHLNAVQFGKKSSCCALCCDYKTLHEASFSNALFLCPACDQKYPTQQALGRRACVT